MPRLLLALLLLSACVAPDPPEPAPADSLAAAPAAPDTLVLRADGRLAEQPAAPLRVEGACPFECCTYGTWTTTAPTPLYAQPGDTTATPAFTVEAGTELDVPTGHVLITRLEPVALRDSALLFLDHETMITAAPGDSVVLLDYVGEGTYRVWYDGETYQADGAAVLPPSDEPTATHIDPGAADRQWWARAEAPDGQGGWLWMDRTPPVEGADACGG